MFALEDPGAIRQRVRGFDVTALYSLSKRLRVELQVLGRLSEIEPPFGLLPLR